VQNISHWLNYTFDGSQKYCKLVTLIAQLSQNLGSNSPSPLWGEKKDLKINKNYHFKKVGTIRKRKCDVFLFILMVEYLNGMEWDPSLHVKHHEVLEMTLINLFAPFDTREGRRIWTF